MDNAEGHAHPVGKLQANAWGLSDIQGNVWQWCADYYDPGYYRNSPEKDPPGPDAGELRVVRGGSWNFPARSCRAANRDSYNPGKAANHIGFRVIIPELP
jgi:formylglycine-generating enzyme required for sulfatase activity